MRRRSAFRAVKASKANVGNREGKQQSKDKGSANKHEAIYPGGVSLLSRWKHPVGVRGHVPRNRSVGQLAN